MKKNKKVLVVAPSKNTQGGITTVIHELSKCDFWGNHHCLWIGTYHNKNTFLKLIYFASGLLKFICLIPFYEIVHIHLSWPVSAIRKSVFFKLALLLKKKTIVHIHSGAEPILNSKKTKLYQFYFKNANITIFLADTIKKKLEERFVFNKTAIIYNPCLQTQQNEYKEKEKIIFFAGHIVEKKGIFDLLKAFRIIANKFPDWTLVIAGSGNTKKLNQLIKEYNISEQSIFLGWINGKQKEHFFATSSIFCLPSYTEGFPMAVLDAWSYGLPVITTPVGGLPDILKHKNNSMVFKPGDIDKLTPNLETLINNGELRKQISAESIKLSKNEFNLQNIAKQIEELYTTLSF